MTSKLTRRISNETLIPVTRFGATGDGATDDTAAIQAADDFVAAVAVSASRTGPVGLWFPAGNYKTTATINKAPRTIWEGPGVRYTSSVTPSRNAQGARIVVAHNGDGLTLTGPGVGNGINQHGSVRNMTIYGDNATYPAARGVVSTAEVREHYFEGVLVVGFSYSFHLTDALAWHFVDCYNSGASKVGIHGENCDEFTFERCQWAGGKYGGVFMGCGPMNGTGNRWQVSSTASLKMIECSSINLQGGFFDSTSIMAPFTGNDKGYGLWLINCQNVKIENFLAYSNGTVAHARVESLAGDREVDIDGSFAGGSGYILTANNLGGGTTGSAGISLTGATWIAGAGATPAGVEFAQETGMAMSDVIIGKQFRSILSFVYAADAGGIDYTANYLPSVEFGTGASARIANDIYLLASGDAVRNIGSPAGRWNNIVGQNHQVFGTIGDTQPVVNLSSAGLAFGPGSSTATDVLLYRSAANVLKTDDKLVTVVGLGVGNSAAATTPGAVTKKMEVFDAAGASLGFVAIYDAIT